MLFQKKHQFDFEQKYFVNFVMHQIKNVKIYLKKRKRIKINLKIEKLRRELKNLIKKLMNVRAKSKML